MRLRTEKDRSTDAVDTGMAAIKLTFTDIAHLTLTTAEFSNGR